MEEAEIERVSEIEATHGWYVARRECVVDLIQKYKKRGKLLDIGCSTGTTLKALPRGIHGFGLDISELALNKAKKEGVMCVKGTVEKMGFKKGSFDVISMLDVLEHIDNDRSALQEIVRLLKQDGVIIVSVPAFPWLWTKHDALNMHKRRYTRQELKTRITEAGLTIKKISYWNCFSFIPTTIFKWIKKDESHNQRLTPKINHFLLKILRLENNVFKYMSLPIGTSLIVIAEKR